MNSKLIWFSFFLLLFNGIMFAQQEVVKQKFYEAEHQTWLDAMRLAKNHSAQENFDVLFYHLRVEVAVDERYIEGNLLCRFTAVENNITSIELDLTDSLIVENIAGNVSSFTRGSDKIYIQLNQPVNVGEESEVTIIYQGVPPQYKVSQYITKGLVYQTHGNNEPVIASLCTPYLAHQWWPCKDGPGDKPDSMYIDITIPNTSVGGIPLMATSNGTLEAVIPFLSKKTFYWRERYPIPPYYVTCVISNYEHFQQTYNGSDGKTFPIDYYVFAEDFEAAQIGVAGIPEAIEIFSELFGSYPFHTEKYGMTQLGFYGAIENQTNTIQNSLNIDWFETSVHELSHQWFGDMITCADWHHGWMNEGFATYCEGLYKERKFGFDSYKNYMNQISYYNQGTVYLEDTSDPARVFVGIIYVKGAWVLHMLRGVLGDETFFNCLSQYAADQQFRYDHATTEDFQQLCEEVSGQDLNYFFDQWIYDEYYPEYNYSYEYFVDESVVHLSINQRQGDNGRRPIFKMPIQIKLNYSDGSSETKTVMNDEQFQVVDIPVTQPVVSVAFDPDNWILKTAIVSGIEDSDELEVDFALNQNYPNPFNPKTTISFQLKVGSEINIKVFDVLGNEVAELLNEYESPGKYNIEFDASELTSGIYFYRLETANDLSTKKMLLLK